MPVFVFKCEQCDKVIEKLFLHKVSSSIEEDVNSFISIGCDCGGIIKRVSSVPNLKFVGKDFYVTEERARREKQRVNNDIRKANANIDKSKREGRETKSP